MRRALRKCPHREITHCMSASVILDIIVIVIVKLLWYSIHIMYAYHINIVRQVFISEVHVILERSDGLPIV